MTYLIQCPSRHLEKTRVKIPRLFAAKIVSRVGAVFDSLKGYRTEVVGDRRLDPGFVVAAYHEHGLFFDSDGGRVADVGFEINQRWVGAKGDDDVSVVGDYVR